MPTFQVRVPAGSVLTQQAGLGGQVMADAEDGGAVTPAKLVAGHRDGDGMILTFESSTPATAVFFEDQRFEVLGD